jgi:energy-coupling factor transporter ATP-binding protein EcfA2
MPDQAVRFGEIRLRRMPGIRDGGFTLHDLSTGINIVYGPNASGKTTTARAIEALLWPGAAAREAAASARFTLNGANWSIDLDTGRIRCQRDGRDSEPPALVPAESRDRYRFSLPELLTATDTDLASAVMRESAGGYDVAAAADRLGFRSGASRPQRELTALQAARARVSEARVQQELLVKEERRLASLEPEVRAAEAAARRVRLLELALDHAEAAEREAAARIAIESFEPVLARLRGDEAERLADLRARVETARRTAAEADEECRSAEAERNGAGLPAEGLPPGLVRELRATLRTLEEHERDVATLERESASAAARRDGARDAVGDGVDEERLAGLKQVRYNVLVELAERSVKALAERAEQAARQRWLEIGSELPDVERLRLASYRLQDWLRLAAGEEASEMSSVRRLGLALSVLLLVCGVVLGVLVHPALLVVSAIALVLGLLIIRSQPGASPQRMIEEEYRRDGFPPPSGWKVDEVRGQLRFLEARISEAVLLHERAHRWAEVAEERSRLDAELRTIEAEKAEVLEVLGLPPTTDVTRLHLVVNAISAWQRARDDANGVAAGLASAREQIAEVLREISVKLDGFGYPGATSAAAVSGFVEDLAERDQRHQLAMAELGRAGPLAERARAEVDSLASECGALLASAGLDPDGDAQLEEWCGHHGTYAATREELRLAEHARGTALERLRAHPDHDPELEELGTPALREQYEVVSRESARLDKLREEVTRIATRVAEARKRHDLEDALAEESDARAALHDARERDVAASIGALLAEQVQNHTRDLHRPAVFHRARQEFARVTRGQYRLEFDDGQPPAFRARDTATGTGHPLSELSSGTRVQLLMAVRLAFVETLESGVALPLLFDETLANADDRRAQAIMEATLELAAAGRQVFYFTAQADEVAKWLELLRARSDVSHRLIDLAKQRRLGEEHELSRPSTTHRPPIHLPPAEGVNYLEFGRVLGVSPLDPTRTRVDGVHLWHLMDDVDLLHGVLSHGVSTYGALHALAEHGGREHRLIDAAYRHASSAARALEAALPLARVGRGGRVDRSVLLESEAITDVFLDRVADLCERFDGEARRIIRALERGEVPRFRNEAREQLRAYLERVGCLDDRDPIDPGEIRARVLGAVARELEEGLISLEQIDRILAAVASEPAVATGSSD